MATTDNSLVVILPQKIFYNLEYQLDRYTDWQKALTSCYKGKEICWRYKCNMGFSDCVTGRSLLLKTVFFLQSHYHMDLFQMFIFFTAGCSLVTVSLSSKILHL